tara:strand:+ start:52 stop:1443 length:1392 start_codon:yes stop_codon:yes gene_type:complete
MALTRIRNSAITLDANEIPNIPASKITSGTFDNARIAASNVTQHATSHIDWESTVKTGDFTAVAGKGYFVNTTGGAITVTLPASPSIGNLIAIVDYAGTFGSNGCTFNRNGSKINGATDNQKVSQARQTTVLTFTDATQGWVQTSGANEGTDGLSDLTYTGEYLIVAGGGAGGAGHRSGGGGAGGYRNSYASETSGRNASTETPVTFNVGTQYTITVGAGGTKYQGTDASSGAQGNGGRGNDSSISGTGLTTITSNGGGGGATYQENAPSGTFGSGAGAGHYSSNTTTGSDGTAGQGFDGGDITVSNSTQQGASGGGAGANGQNGGTTSTTAGGVGLSSSITGSAVVRAGGGGGGVYGSGGNSAGGNGGGGYGGTDSSGTNPGGTSLDQGYYLPVSGTANTGGGGGGTAGPYGVNTSGQGGSGVVILRVATANYSGTTTGSPTVTNSGTDTIMVFNSTGSYTA